MSESKKDWEIKRKVFKAFCVTEEENEIIKKMMRRELKGFSKLMRKLIFQAIPVEERCETMKTDL